MSYEDEYAAAPSRVPHLIGGFAAFLAVLAFALAGLSFLSARERATTVDALQGHVGTLQRRVDALTARNHVLQKHVQRNDASFAPLAANVLKSVFTIEVDGGWYGSGFVAWREGSAMYVITADHVVAHGGGTHVTVVRKGGGWDGEVVARDPAHDVALIRVSARPAGARALWQPSKPPAPPRAGDQLLLVGSPYGLEGTVTTGVVSRVTKREIQTDAAANPGNSGGPAIDKQGHVVGVLVAGAGENLNFVVPIARVCARLRHCG